MQCSTVTWDTPLDEPPSPTDDAGVQARYVFDTLYDYYYPQPVDPKAFRRFCRAVKYPWQPVRVELLKRKVELPRRGRPRRSGTSNGENVPVALSITSQGEERGIGTFLNQYLNHQVGLISLLDDAEDDPRDIPDACGDGIGGLLRDRDDDTRGRDVDLPCRVKACPVCGPKRREAKVDQIMQNFAGAPIHAILATIEEWEAFHKALERQGGHYHRIPTPDGMFIVLTDAEVGQVIDELDVAVILELNPGDGRNMTQSRDWKVQKPEPRWQRVGISPLDTARRAQVYEEEGCRPTKAPRAKGLVGARDVDLPPEDSEAMDRLKDRLVIKVEPELGPDGWPVPRR